MQDLIDGILHVARLEADAVKASPASLSLEDLVSPAVQTGRAIAESKSLRFDVDLSCKAAVVRADPGLTLSVLGNLLDNAFKYTDRGTVKLLGAEGDREVTLHVFDNCSGLSAEELRTIFEPFRRGAHAGKPGSGLGLAIARRAAEAQGGHIGAESLEERGCHFWFTIPKA